MAAGTQVDFLDAESEIKETKVLEQFAGLASFAFVTLGVRFACGDEDHNSARSCSSLSY
jgi:hypothetical protein